MIRFAFVSFWIALPTKMSAFCLWLNSSGDGHMSQLTFPHFGSSIRLSSNRRIHLEEEEGFNLQPPGSIASTIREICGLDFFSTEVAFTPAQAFIVVDYVNEICDMRLKSRPDDGIPDRVVRAIAEELVGFVTASRTPS